MKLLLIDNHDSFTFNLAHLFIRTGVEVEVMPAEAKSAGANAAKADGLVFSPGPSEPQKAIAALDLFHTFAGKKPLFGVCLGMQLFNVALGGGIERAPYPMHGKTAIINQTEANILLQGIPSRFEVARYHSLVCTPVSTQLTVTASYNNIVMALENHEMRIYGVQFHPESFMSRHGLQIAENFIRLCR